MFYPEDSLKRGGRFHLCWVADSWPLRFACVTEKQLWSQDIRKICDDLHKVMTNESGRPRKRFSLRLSSQLLRGLVRFYHRKVDVFLGNLCMLNATVVRNTNKKWQQHEPSTKGQHPRPIPLISIEEPEEEPNLEQLMQTSNNVVANIDDITLKEPIMETNQFLFNDGFGELRPDLAHIADKTIEMMMQADASAAQHSAIDLPADFSAERSHDKSRLAPLDVAQMERISEHDITMFRRSIGGELLPVGDERDIPEIPEIPPPDLNAPQPVVQEFQVPIIQEYAGVSTEATKRHAPEEITLEELEAMPQAKRRRMRDKLIVDKKIKLSSEYLRSRIDNIALELRCEYVYDDFIKIRVPASWYFARPTNGGARLRPNTSPALWSLYSRNLGASNRPPSADREVEMVERQSIVEANVSEQGMLDISQVPTQIVETISQAMRGIDLEGSDYEVSAKKVRTENQSASRRSEHLQFEAIFGNNYEAEKENIPLNMQTPVCGSQSDLTALLQEAGLASILPDREKEVSTETAGPAASMQARDNGNDTFETPLGSLDRTKVSLGDSDKTTDSIKFIRDQWGTEGTMIKILKTIKLGVKQLDIRGLVGRGPVLPEYLNIITARCFSSVLKLKQHGFVNLQKNPDTLEILHITLGPKFDFIV